MSGQTPASYIYPTDLQIDDATASGAGQQGVRVGKPSYVGRDMSSAENSGVAPKAGPSTIQTYGTTPSRLRPIAAVAPGYQASKSKGKRATSMGARNETPTTRQTIQQQQQ